MPLLIEDIVPISLSLVESEDGGKLFVRGDYGYCDKATANKRLYEKRLMLREAKRLGESIRDRKVLGCFGHPSDGRTHPEHISHVITKLDVSDDGRIIGESEILDTDAGRNLAAILKRDVRMGISSRGFGSTVTNSQGDEVVQEDYRLVTFDFVTDPANGTYPSASFESKDYSMPTKTSSHNVDVAALKEEFATMARSVVEESIAAMRGGDASSKSDLEQVAESVVTKLSAQFQPSSLTEDVKQALTEREEIISSLRGEKKLLESKYEDLQAEFDKVSKAARDLGYRVYLEQLIRSDPDAASIRAIVGDPSLYESKVQLDEVVSEARAELQGRRALAEQAAAEQARALKEEKESRAKDREFAKKMEAALEKSLRANNLLQLELYTERRLRNHPQAEAISAMIEEVEPETKAQVDQIIESYAAPRRPREELQEVRARVRNYLGGGISPSSLDEETGDASSVGNGADRSLIPGLSVGEFKKLADVSRPNE